MKDKEKIDAMLRYDRLVKVIVAYEERAEASLSYDLLVEAGVADKKKIEANVSSIYLYRLERQTNRKPRLG